MTGEQLRAARAMLRLEQTQLALEAEISVETLKRFEAATGEIKGRHDNIQNVHDALVARGIEFIDGKSDDRMGGMGVKFALDPGQKYRELISQRVKELTASILNEEYRKDPALYERGADHITSTILADLPAMLKHTMPSTLKFKIGIND